MLQIIRKQPKLQKALTLSPALRRNKDVPVALATKVIKKL